MERLPGVTLQVLLQLTLPVSHRSLGSSSVLDGSASQLNLLPMFISLLRELAKLHGASKGRFWHGDMKPANMLISANEIRLIDPVARPSRQEQCMGPHSFMTVRYNPKAYVRAFADTFGLALCMLEILCDDQPFGRFVRLTDEEAFDVTDGPHNETRGTAKHVLRQCLERFKAKWAEHPMVDWLLSWLDADISNFHMALTNKHSAEVELQHTEKNYNAMLQKLEVFEAEGFTLSRTWKDGSSPWACKDYF
eukprot:gnl/MRDRNA2_/MRDRNA2_139310_c0_seq1.p1 gnl/MRDRNA2_/MRDRNA2_139310_c0~~gnl/MRDRNA2_/MRDRNA2_139310_c0_seq1.p1  ORF type:complete len:257 (+),score=40.18 gnl/MRDRNA2_/MRDRNA2_139310_c0_seq1:22-771(+)